MNMKSNIRVLFLNTTHYSLDDRVFYHQAKCLNENGYHVQITSTREVFKDIIDNIEINSYNDFNLTQKEKINKSVKHISAFKPTIIICDSPLAVLASNIFKNRNSANVEIIYDITEWYPSKKNLNNTTKYVKPFKFILLFIIFIVAGHHSNGFIFGEHYKSLIFKNLFFWKKFIFLPYYPDLNYIECYSSNQDRMYFNILYSGNINIDKGIDSVIFSIDNCAKENPETTISLKIIGNFPNEKDRDHFDKLKNGISKNIQLEISNHLPFIDFCKEIGKYDLFLDLRKNDLENTHCLPIKLFYYLACGRPVIYSDLNSIKKEIKEFNFGYLCNPNDYQSISSYISTYINDKEIYNRHAIKALSISREKYNWASIENNFVSFISYRCSKKLQNNA